MAKRSITVYSERVLVGSHSKICAAVIDILGSTITKVTPTERKFLHPNIQVDHDFGSSLITPAFVNSHTHLPMAALRGIEGTASALSGNVVEDLYFTIEKQMSAGDVRAFARMGCYESLLCGVGFVWVRCKNIPPHSLY
jgi:cytosine/adenosine deaminase-related metal-dependent hydrolase